MICELCAKTIDRNWGDSITPLCEACSYSHEGKELSANNAKSNAREKPETDEPFQGTDPIKTTEWEESYKKWGESIQNSVGCLAWVGLMIWLILVAFGDQFKVTEGKRTTLTGAVQAVRMEVSKTFPGSLFRLESRFGENLWFYIARESFESVPYPDRPKMVARIGKAWCRNIQQKYFLPGVSVRDIQSADKLASYNCVLPKPW